MLRAMFSLEPATVTTRRYPELFQTGETAFGKPIVDGQHPHDFFMEVAVLYDWKLAENTTISFYAAPVGDPALGPTAFPHRMSASENPLAPLRHHLQDSALMSLQSASITNWPASRHPSFTGASPMRIVGTSTSAELIPGRRG